MTAKTWLEMTPVGQCAEFSVAFEMRLFALGMRDRELAAQIERFADLVDAERSSLEEDVNNEASRADDAEGDAASSEDALHEAEDALDDLRRGVARLRDGLLDLQQELPR